MLLVVGCCAATKVEKLPVDPLNSEMVIVEEVSKVNLASWLLSDIDAVPARHKGSMIASPAANVRLAAVPLVLVNLK